MRSIKGEFFEIPGYTPTPPASQNFIDVLGPGVLFDKQTNATTLPVFYEYFLTGESFI